MTAPVSLTNKVSSAVAKKVVLFETDFWRYSVRCIFAGVYLTLGTAFAVTLGQKLDHVVHGVGYPIFGLMFFVGLYTIVLLNAELATSNMMYLGFGVVHKKLSLSKATQILLVCTFFNLVGAVLVAFLLSRAVVFSHVDAESLVSTITETKLGKSSLGLLVEGILANVAVNMGIIGVAMVKEFSGKFLTLVVTISMFTVMGLEHVIANFSLVSLVGFSAESLPSHFDAAHIARNWAIVFIGNLIGGGVCMGAAYAWLNRGDEKYRD
ncbi:formate/nitrite transporter family protein [Corynebacterium pseudotuberculosis]|uniref:formate/nitrite transporter family protein n=1 Tax=Corynebacterium pseudotuberculosis TaxID=1719 RepID=UPI000654DFCB|nr:formate/nitrite transporter family protein [Corynebacterium pseudotuberculosis]AFH90223.2 formate/nitrite transporter family protein [Corynebacterium pseudotuberculosis 31]